MSNVVAPDTDAITGLTSAQVEASRADHGRNQFSPLEVPTWFDLVKDAVADPMIKVLLVCAAVALVLAATSGESHELVDGLAIMAAVVVVTGVGVLNQLRAQRDYTALDAVASQERVRVIRDSEVQDIDSDELVYGDVLEVNTGDVLPADAVFIRGSDLLVNEAAITGEPDTAKTIGEDLFGSSRVLDGSGRAVVVAVGDSSVFGAVRREVGERDKTTPLEERLDSLAGTIGKVGTYAAALTFFALIGSGIYRSEVAELGLNTDTLNFVLSALTIAITIVVVAVPEGLPLAVTLSLAYTTRKMANDNALVRELSACETMGAATIVCSDKTGTLTEGLMTLRSATIAGAVVTDLEGLSGAEFGEVYGPLLEAISVNSSADLVERDGETVVAGNSTEGALLRWMREQGIEYRPLRDAATTVARREFNSSRKYMMTAVTTPGSEANTVYLKGAPEIVLGACTHIETPEGVAELDDVDRARIVEDVRAHATMGNRTLGFATGLKPAGTDDDALVVGLTFSALFVISDPIRAEVPAAVERCRGAGVRVMIITGDIKETGAEIGRQAGIVRSDDELVLEGEEFRLMSDDEATAKLRSIVVLARALPDDKKRMVELLQATGDVVAVTGDGVNDAPALVTADVGFAMGSGSKVAREASDIVLVDDNFVSLVKAIRWGRSVFENIRKFLQFQLTVNVAALTTAFLAALLGKGTPLTAVQLLWVNLIMDSLAALALALEPPRDELFDQPPHGRNEPLISTAMWSHVIVLGTFMFVVLQIILNTDWLIATDDTVYRYTFLFNVFVWFQIWNELNCRSVRFYRSPFRGLRDSRSFLAIVALIVVLQVGLIQFGGSVFSTTPLAAREWVLSIVIGATVLIVGALVRLGGRALTSRP